MEVTHLDLDSFVEKSDTLGGPGHPATLKYWSDFHYITTVKIDTNLNPDSAEYFSQMIQLYEEISGRQLDQQKNEMTFPNVNELVGLESPYAFQKPSDRAIHYLRLAKAIEVANLPKDACVLDMGCGWGLSSELLAQLGFNVSAIDINPLFVELVQRRAKRLNLSIKVTESSFDEYVAEPMTFDAVLFYECFHHAIKPKDLLKNMYLFLKQQGKLILAGEPIQNLWWPNWGIRLDALSVYCIRKFGWFESGCSEMYLKKILAENNFVTDFFDHPDPTIGKFVIAAKFWRLGKNELERCIVKNEWWIENDYLVSNRNGEFSSLMLVKPHDAKKIVFEIWNFSPMPLDIIIRIGAMEKHVTLGCDYNQISLDCLRVDSGAMCSILCKPWCPNEVFGTDDKRFLGFHLKQISFD